MWTRTAPACPKPQRHSLYSGAGAARAPTPSPERLLRQGPALQPPRARASRDTSEAGSPGPEGPRLPDVSAVGRFICKATPGSVPGPWCFMLSCKRTHTHTRMCAHTHGHLHTGPTGTESKLACRGGTRGTRARGGEGLPGEGTRRAVGRGVSAPVPGSFPVRGACFRLVRVLTGPAWSPMLQTEGPTGAGSQDPGPQGATDAYGFESPAPCPSPKQPLLKIHPPGCGSEGRAIYHPSAPRTERRKEHLPGVRSPARERPPAPSPERACGPAPSLGSEMSRGFLPPGGAGSAVWRTRWVVSW